MIPRLQDLLVREQHILDLKMTATEYRSGGDVVRNQAGAVSA